MKRAGYLLLYVFLIAGCPHAISQTGNKSFNSSLADSLGADEYGMKNYFFVMLKTGPNKENDPDKRSVAFNGHMKNMVVMEKLNKLIIAGPFGQNDKNYRGIFIIAAASEEEVRELLKGDTAITEGYLVPEIIPWYGSAALPLYIQKVPEITRKQIIE